MWTDLVRARGTDAADDPATAEVLALLARVPPSSLDAPAATELRGRIESEQKALAEERARRERLVARPLAGAPTASAGVPMAAAEGAPGAAPGAAGRAGGVALPRLERGLKLEQFLAAYGACFEDRGEVELTGSAGEAPRQGRMWRMKDDEACRSVEPRLADKVVVFAGDEFAGLNPASALKTVEQHKTVELGRLPDGGLGIRTDAGVEPLPPGMTLRVDGAGTAGAEAPAGPAGAGAPDGGAR